jgi:hypothetical protein
MGAHGSALSRGQEEAWCMFCTPPRDEQNILMKDERWFEGR